MEREKIIAGATNTKYKQTKTSKKKKYLVKRFQQVKREREKEEREREKKNFFLQQHDAESDWEKVACK